MSALKQIVHAPTMAGSPVIMPVVEGIYSISRNDGERWFVIHTDPQCESHVSRALVARKITHYLPRLRRWKRQSARAMHQKMPKRHMTAPLLTRYVFATIPPDLDGRVPFGRVTDIVGVHRILSDMKGPLIVGRDLVEEIERRETAGEFDDTASHEVQTRRGVTTVAVPKWVEIGLRVTVLSGPMAGFPGVIEDVVDDDRVKVGVIIFGRSAPMQLSVDEIKLAS